MERIASHAVTFSGPPPSPREALPGSSVGRWEIDLADGTLIGCDTLRRLCDMTGTGRLSVAALRGRLAPRRVLDAGLAALRAGDAVQGELRLRGDDGTARWVLLHGAPLRDGAGPSARAAGTVTDITALRRRLQARFARRSRAPEPVSGRPVATAADLAQLRKLEALGALTSGVAHDLNNTLTAIINSYWLIDRRIDDERIRSISAQGSRAASRASHLVRKLLDYARKERPMDVAVDPADLLRDVEPILRHAAGPGVDLTVTARPGIPTVVADPRELETALINLVVNARDAMPHGGALTVAAGPAAPAGAVARVAFTVRDSGCGMSAEVLARATEPFFTTKAAGAGTGLGLAMVRSFAERTGGTILLDSRPGSGTVATLMLPAGPAMAAGRDAPPEVPAPAPPAAGRVLLVDDDDDVREVTAECLRQLGWRVTEAAGGAAGLVAAQAEACFDLVLADVAMPGMDGPAFALRLRADRPNLPVLFMSGDHDAADPLPGEMLLEKPFTAAALAEAIARKLGRPASAPDRMLRRLRDRRLRAAYEAWLAAGAPARLPPPAAVDPAGFDAADHAALLAVDPTTRPVDFCFVRVGQALEARFGGGLLGKRLQAHAGEPLGSLAGAAVRCARTLQPSYERAKFDFCDGAPSGLERLMLPLSQTGAGITHLLSVAIFDP